MKAESEVIQYKPTEMEPFLFFVFNDLSALTYPNSKTQLETLIFLRMNEMISELELYASEYVDFQMLPESFPISVSDMTL